MKKVTFTRIILSLLISITLHFLAFADTRHALDQVVGQAHDWVYTVVEGDSLSLILKRCCKPEVDLQMLASHNGLTDANLIIPGLQLRVPIALLKTQSLGIQTIVVSGNVTVKKNQNTKFSALRVSEEIVEGDLINTGAKSMAKLRFADHSELTIQPNTTLIIESSHQIYQSEKREVKVKLTKGRVEIEANPSHQKDRTFEVETPSAVAVVRGTQFRIGVDDGLSTEETLDGAVAFSVADQSVLVTKDYGSAAKVGQPPIAPQPLPTSPSVDQFQTTYEYLPVDFNLMTNSNVVAFVSQLAKDEGFTEIVSEDILPNVQDATLLSFNDLPDGQYYLKLRAKDANSLESRDAIHAFNVNAMPYPPSLTQPLVAEKIPLKGQLFNWSKLDDATGYIIQIASDEAFEHILLERQVAYNAFQWTRDLPKGSAYWRVAGENRKKIQKFSKPRQLVF